MDIRRVLACAAVLLSAVVAAGCSPRSSSGHASRDDCTAIAIRAVRGQARLTGVPAQCRGLGPGLLDQIVRIAASEISTHGTKSQRRHLAIVAYRRLEVLTAAAEHEAAARAQARARRLASSPPVPPAPGPHRLSIPVGLAALISWVLAAASGGALVLRRRARRPRRPLQPVLVAHLSLALSGLAAWAAYLLTNWVALAWTALGVLLPVAGLGMATLILAIPDPGPDRVPLAAPGQPPSPTSPVSEGSRLADAAAARRPTLSVRDRTATPSPAGSRPEGRRRASRPPVLLIAAHGALATVTILLALLGALAAVVSH